MRTTIELTNSQRARLLNLAAQRGEKGFSRLIQQAVDHLLEGEESRKERIDFALSVEGTLSADAAADLDAATARIRATWR